MEAKRGRKRLFTSEEIKAKRAVSCKQRRNRTVYKGVEIIR